MNAVVTNPATDHVDDVACDGGFHVRRASVSKGPRHDAHGPAVHQGFPNIAVIKDDRSVHRRNPGFVSTDAYPCVNPSQHPRGVEQVVGQVSFPIGRTKAKHIGVRNGSGTQTRTENVTIDADNAGHRPAVGVQRGR